MARGNFGERLKREREMREVSLDEISSATRIGTRFLEALENEDWARLPGGVFNRGFVRAVARYLGLDEESLLAEYDLAHGQQPIPPAPPPATRRASELTTRIVPALTVLIALLVFTVGGYVGWHRLRALHPTPGPSPSSAAPAQPTSGPPDVPETLPSSASTSNPSESLTSSASAAPLHLMVSSSDAVHVQVLADGKIAFDNELSAGQTLRFSAQSEFAVSASNSSAVLLVLNGQAMPPLGAPGASGRIVLTQRDLNRAPDGTSQP
jgi:cytoskeleton protein RodZ